MQQTQIMKFKKNKKKFEMRELKSPLLFLLMKIKIL